MRRLPARNLTGSHTVVSHRVFCRPCMLRECPIDHRCMTRIEPARVLDAVLSSLPPATGAAERRGSEGANA